MKRTLAALGVSARSYYRWLREQAWERRRPAPKPVPPYEATAEEKRRAGVCPASPGAAAPGVGLADGGRGRGVSESVDGVSHSQGGKPGVSVATAEQACADRSGEGEPAGRALGDGPDVRAGAAATTYYWVGFLDEYSRYLVHWELLSSMDGQSLARAAQAALATLPRGADGALLVTPEIRSDNGSGYVSKEFRRVLRQHGLKHTRIKPHCPEENGLMERANRTLREELDGEEWTTRCQARDVLARVIQRYNEERLHSAIDYLRPIDYYRGDPNELRAERREKLAEARHRRREANLTLRQTTLPFPDPAGY